jgi:hypothetical protein
MPINERGGAGKTDQGRLEFSGNSAPLPLIKPYRITLFSAADSARWISGACIFVFKL